MLKLLPRNPSSPLLCTSVSTGFISMPSPYKPNSSSFLRFRFSLTKARILSLTQHSSSFSSLSMPLAFLLPAGCYSSLSACIARKPTIQPVLTPPGFYSSTCRCSSDVKTTRAPFRAWVVARPASFCTVASTDGSVMAAAAKTDEGLKGSDDDAEKEKAVKLSRRQRRSSEVLGNADLLTIPGVGPKNLRKLVEKGFTGMAELKQFYKDKFRGKSNEKMVEYLQSSVGIIHKNHAESITVFIKETVDEELKDTSTDVKSSQKDRITFCVEGNISVGKTTFLQRIVSDTIELRDLVEVVPEPIDKWQDVGPDHFNILDAFYAEPHRYAYTFQNYVFVTRVMQERESSSGVKPLRLMERSVFSDRMVFVRAVHEAKWMNEMEISIYDSWFDPVVSVLPGLIPDGFIYLRATPDTCHKRMQLRRRAEEGGVSIDYLRDLHEKHESWLFPFQSGNHGVLALSKPPLQLDCSLHPEIRDRVFYLEGDHMHSSIQKVPALILDCEANIDFSRDIEAKERYARQVAEFFKYVKNRKEVSPAKSGQSSRVGNQQILLPREGGLFFPNDKNFPGAALQSLQFRRAMSSFMPGQ